MKLTNVKIEQLEETLQTSRNNQETIKKAIQKEYYKIFEADSTLQKDIENAQNASEYMGKDDGIYSWFKVKSDLSMFNEYLELKEYLENYVADHCLTIDWENDCFENYQGDDNIMIQDDTRHDNGVWQRHKVIIEESEYKDESGEVNEEKRNELIEAHMEKTGYFPGVFKVTQHGDIYYVNTQGGVKCSKNF